MNKQMKVILGGLVITIFLAAGYFSVNALRAGLCGEEELKVLNSPDGNHVAKMYLESCGATTAYGLYISVDGKRVFTSGHYYETDIDIRWEGNEELIIEFSGDEREIFKFREQYKNVKIELIK